MLRILYVIMQIIDKVKLGVSSKDQILKDIESIFSAGKIPENTFEISHEILTPSKWTKTK